MCPKSNPHRRRWLGFSSTIKSECLLQFTLISCAAWDRTSFSATTKVVNTFSHLLTIYFSKKKEMTSIVLFCALRGDGSRVRTWFPSPRSSRSLIQDKLSAELYHKLHTFVTSWPPRSTAVSRSSPSGRCAHTYIQEPNKWGEFRSEEEAKSGRSWYGKVHAPAFQQVLMCLHFKNNNNQNDNISTKKN